MKKYISFILALAMLLCFMPVSFALTVYQVGGQVMDFTIDTHDGRSVNLYDTLKEKELVVINIWASWCGPCRSEFPYIQEVYEEYSDRVEIIAVSVEASDTDRVIGEFAKEMGLTFPMGRDTANLSYLFQAQYIPTTAIVSRSGRIEYMHSSAFTSAESFKSVLDAYLMRKPTVLPSGSAALSDAANAQGGVIEFKNSSDEYAWPMTVSEKDGRSVLKSSNAAVPNSYASVKANVSADAGDVLVVEFKTSTEPIVDLMKICVDNAVVKVFGGEHDWMTYAYPFESAGAHEIEITYVKNMQENMGEDCVWIDSVRVVKASEAAQALSMNPDYPVQDALSVVPVSEEARKVLIFDPLGSLEYYFGEFEAYVVNAASVEIAAGLTDDIDPEIAFLLCDYDNASHPVAEITPDENGCYRVSFLLDDIEETGYPYTTVYLFSDPALEPVMTVMLFRDEENLNVMMALVSSDEENPAVWAYEEDLDEQAMSGEMEEYAYLVRFADQNGDPVPGVMAQVCSDTVCTVYVSDDAGECAFALAPDKWEMHLLMIPDGYSGDMQSARELAAGGEIIEIVLEKK